MYTEAEMANVRVWIDTLTRSKNGSVRAAARAALTDLTAAKTTRRDIVDRIYDRVVEAWELAHDA